MDPAKRQIFRDASGQIFSLILRLCRKQVFLNEVKGHFMGFDLFTHLILSWLMLAKKKWNMRVQICKCNYANKSILVQICKYNQASVDLQVQI